MEFWDTGVRVAPHVVPRSSRSLPKLPVETKRMRVLHNRVCMWRFKVVSKVWCCTPAPLLPKSQAQTKTIVSPKPQDKGCGSLLGVWNGMQRCFSTARPNPTSPPTVAAQPYGSLKSVSHSNETSRRLSAPLPRPYFRCPPRPSLRVATAIILQIHHQRPPKRRERPHFGRDGPRYNTGRLPAWATVWLRPLM